MNENKRKDILVGITWILILITGAALGMVLCLVPINEGKLELYKNMAITIALVCAGLIEIIMCVGLKGWTIKAVKKEEIKDEM